MRRKQVHLIATDFELKIQRRISFSNPQTHNLARHFAEFWITEQKCPTLPGQIGSQSNRTRIRKRHLAPGQVVKRQHIPRLAVNLTWVKNNAQCTNVDESGKRCPETRMLEVDHIVPVCRGGDNSFENLRLLCRSHNQHAARELLGADYIGPRKSTRDQIDPNLN